MDALRGFAAGKKEAPGAKTDLLLRLFESEWFNEWMCLQYLWQNPTPGVEDYLCNKLFAMPEGAIERFLMEFVYLAVSKPGSALERTIVSLCSKSFPIALKVRPQRAHKVCAGQDGRACRHHRAIVQLEGPLVPLLRAPGQGAGGAAPLGHDAVARRAGA